jgi:hypothetical protein
MPSDDGFTLSAEQINALSDLQKSNLANMEALFSSPGWAYIQNWIDGTIEQTTQRCLTAGTWEEYLVSRVVLTEFQRWKNLEQTFLFEYATLADQVLEERTLAVEDEYE